MTHSDTLPTDFANLGSVGALVSVFIRLLLFGGGPAGVVEAVLFRFRDDAEEAPVPAVDVEVVDFLL